MADNLADNLKDRGQRDRARINVSEKWEVKHWTRELQVTEEQLRRAVEKVGSLADDVRQELGRVRSATGTQPSGMGVTSDPDL